MPSQPANARSAVVIARCRGEAMRTSGFGSRNLVTGASDAACAAPFFVRRVSYMSGSTKSEASHRFEARYSFISVRPCLTRCRIFRPSSPSILDAADDDADERGRGGGEERPPVTRRWGGTYEWAPSAEGRAAVATARSTGERPAPPSAPAFVAAPTRARVRRVTYEARRAVDAAPRMSVARRSRVFSTNVFHLLSRGTVGALWRL
mmetsp:Transcript_6867/g.27996  ORF Transcript_6867/g.27996 Transcript_6867/m.27996 type:complete len:206 (+) Transcript_6867:367-984(+)